MIYIRLSLLSRSPATLQWCLRIEDLGTRMTRHAWRFRRFELRCTSSSLPARLAFAIIMPFISSWRLSRRVSKASFIQSHLGFRSSLYFFFEALMSFLPAFSVLLLALVA